IKHSTLEQSLKIFQIQLISNIFRIPNPRSKLSFEEKEEDEEEAHEERVMRFLRQVYTVHTNIAILKKIGNIYKTALSFQQMTRLPDAVVFLKYCRLIDLFKQAIILAGQRGGGGHLAHGGG
ncbi:hypothetical protein ACJX0J_022370, partial [Zea mays]